MIHRVRANRFALREAQRHMGRYLHQQVPGRWMRLCKRIDAFLNACWLDLYGVAQADTLIIGPDRLLNLVLAYRCASMGKSVFVYEGCQQEWIGYEAVLQKRLALWHPSFQALMESTLGLQLDPADIQASLAGICAQYSQADGSPLIYAPHNISLISDKLTESSRRYRFWVEPGSAHASPDLATLEFWAPEAAGRYDTEDGKADRFALEVDQVVLTGIPGPSLGDLASDTIKIGEALRPTGRFSVFRTKDRLQDVAESLGVDLRE